MYISDIFEDPLDEKWEVPRESICIKDFAGEGAFGYVARAEAFELPGNITTPCTVAVKMLKGSGYFKHCHLFTVKLQTRTVGVLIVIMQNHTACTVSPLHCNGKLHGNCDMKPNLSLRQ